MPGEGVSIQRIPGLGSWVRTANPARRRPVFGWLVRPRRVLLVLAAMWVLNLFDLGFTLIEAGRSHFHELNPVAAQFLSQPGYVLAAYKAILVGLGSTILLALARHRIAEVTAWFLLGVYIAVAVRWSIYYKHLNNTVPDPATQLIVRIEPSPWPVMP